MKCPKKNKNCTPSLCFKASNKDFLCSGYCKKPTKWHKDHVWLCLNGTFSQSHIEMTDDEALGIVSALTATLMSRKLWGENDHK